MQLRRAEAATGVNAEVGNDSQVQRNAYPRMGDNLVEYSGPMSPASLIIWTLSYIGAPLTDYQKANLISRYWIPSHSVYGYRDAAMRWHSMNEAKSVANEDIYTQGMDIIRLALQSGCLHGASEARLEDYGLAGVAADGASMSAREHQDAVMVNIMRWLALSQLFVFNQLAV